ncbi:hypothetical protein CKO28_04765 [Rhodovibrio sodomensis]|uniref:Uncharacterized protein n=1 Tax=Rhodovibrio sodomensis TaxID=1088 RepID=A0ABS1DD61_9PROT|nr:hypothetical protein [Rhodovibrio sodomensis]MBK1667340.1 hypothetical protein [Rhodovibrio sodomensis]
MCESTHYCETCRWQGSDPDSFAADERAQVALALQPGERMPSGKCPACAAPTYPAGVFAGQLDSSPASDVETPQVWGVSITRMSESYLLFLEHPKGHGCELMVELAGGRPQVSFTPWSEPDDFTEEEPLGIVKVGCDQLLFWSGRRNVSPVVCARPDVTRCNSAMTRQDWDALVDWNDLLPVQSLLTDRKAS